jgi:hypothetical protein
MGGRDDLKEEKGGGAGRSQVAEKRGQKIWGASPPSFRERDNIFLCRTPRRHTKKTHTFKPTQNSMRVNPNNFYDEDPSIHE